MILIVFAGFSLWALAKALDGATDVHAIDGLPGPDGAMAGEAVVATNAKVAAIVSVVFWLAAITAGRLIGYTMPPPPL